MSESFKLCPICGTSNPRTAAVCATCGAALSNVQPSAERSSQPARLPAYDFQFGETDLLESQLHQRARIYLAGLFVLLTALMGLGLLLFIAPNLLNRVPAEDDRDGAQINTPTPRALIDFPTITAGPPTRTRTPTATITLTPTDTEPPPPCYQPVAVGQTLTELIGRCGHVDLDVIPLVLEINGLAAPENLIAGATIEIPWPTPTDSPAAAPEATAEGTAEAVSDTSLVMDVFSEDFDPFFIPTATLPPEIQFHVVQSGETIISIGIDYNSSVEILSGYNPEIDFFQCDFGERFGGPRCTVQLSEGQLVRVPAPTVLPTLSPTPSGSETATPTPTATFNVPSAVSPSNRAFFRADELVLLRWIGSATLGPDEVYRLRVEDVTAGIVYTVDSIEYSYLIPEEWQGLDAARHEYVWQVNLINIHHPRDPIFSTEPLIFIWEGRGQES